MKNISKKQLFAVSAALLLLFILSQCTHTESAPSPLSHQARIVRGEYLVTVSLCHDCHSPKIFNPDGTYTPEPNRLLSGHQAGTQLPIIDTSEVSPDKWALGSPDFTAWVGPWGISFAANLTPDSTTGIGAWTEENFLGALRTGKHLGQAGGRPILPPMPWSFIGKMTDEDLKCIFAYLKSLKPVNNQVPTPVLLSDITGLQQGNM